MPWKVLGEDRKVTLVVDPDFSVDLIEIARSRPIWIIDSCQNTPRIDAAWRVGKQETLYSISRSAVHDPENRLGSLGTLLAELPSHYYREYNGVIVYGLRLSDEVERQMKDWGFKAVELVADGFLAHGRYNREDLIWGIEDEG